MIDAIIDFHMSKSLARGCIFGNMALEFGGNGSEISEFVKGVFIKRERNFERGVNRSVQDGELVFKETPLALILLKLFYPKEAQTGILKDPGGCKYAH